ncbi:uncharacterized protein LOC124562658 [Schistocerca americana]|uniref:uncharacterized protein LOC124562658 n=1 Tax=Schistocerca americana TaxID=7009 RepID=UPI001F5008A6|nr:uncharacterized protein LOC124562658 [Schistocerca americana]
MLFDNVMYIKGGNDLFILVSKMSWVNQYLSTGNHGYIQYDGGVLYPGPEEDIEMAERIPLTNVNRSRSSNDIRTVQREDAANRIRYGHNSAYDDLDTSGETVEFERVPESRPEESNLGVRRRRPNRPRNRGRGHQSADIATSSETVPLLSESVTDGAAISTAGVKSSGQIAIAAGTTTAAAAGAAYGVKKLVERVQNKGYTLPGSDYVGPGNPINIGAPRSGADAIAKEHDVGYDNLLKEARERPFTEEEFRQRVQQLDAKAIIDFAIDWSHTRNWHSFVGKYGLKLKTAVEQRIGKTLYPKQPNAEKTDHDRPSTSGSATGTSSVDEHHVDHEISDSEEDEDEQGPEETQQHSEPQRLVPYSDSDEGMSSPMQVDSGKRQAAAGHSGGSKKKKTLTGTAAPSANVLGDSPNTRVDPLPAPSILDTGNITRYRKVHRFFTYGLAYKVIEHEKAVCMVTPLAEIPVDRPFLYMTPSEFDLLPDGSRIVHSSVKVIARNPRIAFPTNSSDTELATLNQNKNMITSVGINLKIPGINVKPTAFTANAPMETTAIDDKRQFHSIWQSWYGYRNDEADFLTKVPAHQFGQPINLKYYYACVSSSKD